MANTIDPALIVNLHKESILNWKHSGVHFTQPSGIYLLIEENHSFNFKLWDAEDKARRDDLGSEFVHHAKREIDQYNQQRNNRMEQIDEWCVQALQPALPETCPVHTETPGMIIDRLSILSLKAYHMGIQTARLDVDESHRVTCAKKLAVIDTQLKQLTESLALLLTEISQKKRTFRVYHQFKMYNDANLNPQLYSQHLVQADQG